MSNLLDTNFLSELRKPKPKPRVLRYFSNLPIEDQFISDVSLAEIRFGIETLPDNGSRLDLSQWLNQEIRPSLRDALCQSQNRSWCAGESCWIEAESRDIPSHNPTYSSLRPPSNTA